MEICFLSESPNVTSPFYHQQATFPEPSPVFDGTLHFILIRFFAHFRPEPPIFLEAFACSMFVMSARLESRFFKAASSYSPVSLPASLPSVKYNDLDDEAKRMLTEAAKAKGVDLQV